MRPFNPRLWASLAAFAAAGLAGCTTTHIAPPAPAVLSDASKNWFYAPASKDEPAKLAYGQPNSDDIDLMLWCAAARRQVQFAPFDPDDATPKHMVVASGGLTLDLPIKPDKRLGPVGTVPLDAALLAAFRADGRLRMTLDDHPPLDLNAKPPEGPKQVQSFFGVCK